MESYDCLKVHVGISILVGAFHLIMGSFKIIMGPVRIIMGSVMIMNSFCISYSNGFIS